MTKKLVDSKELASSFVKALPADASISTINIALENNNDIIHKPRILKLGSYSWTLPEERPEYKFLVSSERALDDLGLDKNEPKSELFQKIVSGQFYLEQENKEKLEKGEIPFPYAQAYAGWQFGQFAGQLGDGRVTNLFEITPALSESSSNRDRGTFELQLKGSGKTPYSRFADGKAVIRSSIREYLISEHLHAIGIPSTRALALTFLPKTYAQRHRAEKCAIVARFAELWIRLGTFDLYRWRGDRVGIRQLSDYIIKDLFTIQGEKFSHFQQLVSIKGDFFENSKVTIGENLTEYDKMYYEIIIRNAATTAMWQCYGFLNGVLNTDNTSVLGLSMDFGPFSIMDKFDPNYTPNSEDHENRYGYKNTPTAIWWNLTRLGENLAELIGAGPELINEPKFKNEGILKKDWEEKIITRATKVIEIGGEIYKYTFTKNYVETMFNRLGLSHSSIDYSNLDKHNSDLIAPLLDILKKVQCDYNKFFLILQKAEIDELDGTTLLSSLLLPEEKSTSLLPTHEVDSWLAIYKKYLGKGKVSSAEYNPLFLPRNWILDQVIEKIEDLNGEDLQYLEKLQKMCLYPYNREKWGPELKEFEDKWLLQGDIGEEYSMLQCSCSS